MTFKLACGDVMPGCSARFEHTDKAAMMGEVVAHARQVHGIHEITPEVAAAVDSKIQIVA